MEKLDKLRFMLITDRRLTELPLLETIRLALEGGVSTVQLREKDLDGRGLFFLASELRRMTSDYQANLIINDRADVALAVDADGVHLGKDSMPLRDIRRLIGPSRLMGFSAHNMQEAVAAEEGGADYITLSPIFQSPGKSKPISPRAILMIKEHVRIPVIALGGIKEENVQEVLASKADGIAVLSGIMASAEPEKQARLLRDKLNSHKSMR